MIFGSTKMIQDRRPVGTRNNVFDRPYLALYEGSPGVRDTSVKLGDENSKQSVG